MSIELRNISYTYMKKTPFEKTALFDINLTINEGEFIAIAGHTGSGKSTLIQIMAGLIKSEIGEVIVDGVNLNSKDKSAVRGARLKIGIVFQYPESQLFEETVIKDIAFAPTNINLDEAEINQRVVEAMKLVGLSYDELKDVSPFNLSGGQQRRVAIAGVLAMRPKYLILDEPTAGLDPQSHKAMMQNIKILHDKHHMTIILVSHNMDDIAQFANRMIVLSQGRVIMDDTPRKIFNNSDILKAAGLAAPSVTQFLTALKANGLNITTQALTIDDCEKAIIEYLKILELPTD